MELGVRRVLSLRAWSALAPGLQTAAHWKQWALQSVWPSGEVTLDLSHIPAMARRRLGTQAKWAIAVADEVLAQAQQPDLPVIWASRYGDAAKSLALLQDQAAGEPLSPTAFGLSVHNGIGAQHSILRGMRANAICVAASHSAPEAGVMEALSLLCEGAPEVMLVCYDAPLPAPYDLFHDEPMLPFAWAALLTLAAPGTRGFALQAASSSDTCALNESPSHGLPQGLQVLHFLLHEAATQWRRPLFGATSAQTATPSGHWLWERCHA